MALVKRVLFFGISPFLYFYWYVLDTKRITSRAIILHNDHILLVREIAKKYWSFPGGKIEKGESPQEAVKRELYEELSLSVDIIDYKLGTYTSATKEDKQNGVHIFVLQLDTPDFRKKWELEDAKWFPLESLPTLSPAIAQRIAELKRGDKDIVSIW